MKRPFIEFYDTSRCYYASYYLNGFAELARVGEIDLLVVTGPPKKFRSALKAQCSQDLLFTMLLFRYVEDGAGGEKETWFCIDTHDASCLNSTTGSAGFHLPLLRQVDAYFKVNYNSKAINHSVELRTHANKIFSIAQFIPVRPHNHWSLLKRVLLPAWLQGYKPGLGYSVPYTSHFADAKLRIRDLRNFESLEKILAHRKIKKDIDVLFLTGFHHNPSLEDTMQQRLQIMQGIKEIATLRCQMGFVSSRPLPEKYSDFHHPLLKQQEYLQLIAKSRVVVYTRGIEGCISSKFSLAMAVGTVMVGEPLGNDLGLLEQHPHLRDQFGYSTASDISQRAIALAENFDENEKLREQNLAMFDSCFTPRAIATRTLSVALSECSTGTPQSLNSPNTCSQP